MSLNDISLVSRATLKFNKRDMLDQQKKFLSNNYSPNPINCLPILNEILMPLMMYNDCMSSQIHRATRN